VSEKEGCSTYMRARRVPLPVLIAIHSFLNANALSFRLLPVTHSSLR
jgi:hypothetical protein